MPCLDSRNRMQGYVLSILKTANVLVCQGAGPARNKFPLTFFTPPTWRQT